MRSGVYAVLIGAGILCTGLTGCAAPARSSRLQVQDFQDMAAAMALSLTQSPALAARSADSPAWVVSIDKVRNLSSDVMTEAEQWAVMADLRSSASMGTLRQQKNIRFVLPPERVQKMRLDPDAYEFDRSFSSERQPTHVMTATFRSVTRADADRRTDLYYCEFQILEFATGQPVWADRFEFKRQARGKLWD